VATKGCEGGEEQPAKCQPPRALLHALSLVSHGARSVPKAAAKALGQVPARQPSTAATDAALAIPLGASALNATQRGNMMSAVRAFVDAKPGSHRRLSVLGMSS
jgi:hypothetical protein